MVGYKGLFLSFASLKFPMKSAQRIKKKNKENWRQYLRSSVSLTFLGEMQTKQSEELTSKLIRRSVSIWQSDAQLKTENSLPKR